MASDLSEILSTQYFEDALIEIFKIWYVHSCADPEGGGDRGFGPPLKNLKKNIGSFSNTGLDPL